MPLSSVCSQSGVPCRVLMMTKGPALPGLGAGRAAVYCITKELLSKTVSFFRITNRSKMAVNDFDFFAQQAPDWSTKPILAKFFRILSTNEGRHLFMEVGPGPIHHELCHSRRGRFSNQFCLAGRRVVVVFAMGIFADQDFREWRVEKRGLMHVSSSRRGRRKCGA
jgi:hypothetical protein